MVENIDFLNNPDLLKALSTKFKEPIISATSDLKFMQGGTVAQVYLVTGIAHNDMNVARDYKIVLKIQNYWERPNDTHSWRREYDLYTLNKDLHLTSKLHIPRCYLALIRKKTTYLWLEYVQGYSGLELTTDMLEETAYELGRFQGLTIANKNQSILMENFTGVDFLEKELTQWYWQTYDYQFLCSKDSNLPLHVKEMLKRNDWDDESSIIYHYLRHKECNLPKHLKDMIYHIDDHKDSIFKYFSSFPSVINHRDFWIENIIYDNSMIYLIDCDCIGFGYLGEDLASLIGDDTLTENLMVYFERLIPAYNRGIAEFQNIVIDAKMIHEIILIKYGYRLIQNHMFTNDDNQKEDIQSRLQVLFDILNKK